MKKCLFLVEGPYDKLRLSLLEDLFDPNKLIIIPFNSDKLKKKEYFLQIDSEIKSVLNIEKTYDVADFDYRVQVCDTDGCFIDDSKVLENLYLKHTIYYSDHIETSNLKSFMQERQYKKDNIGNILKKNTIELYYNSTNIDHSFDNIQNPSKKQKKSFALKMYKLYKGDYRSFIKLLYDCNKSGVINYDDSWKYVMKNDNSLSSCSNLLIFILKNYNELKEDVKPIVDEVVNY